MHLSIALRGFDFQQVVLATARGMLPAAIFAVLRWFKLFPFGR
jgi:hypothetical protein